MPQPHEPTELLLVIQALTSGLSDCVEWKSDALLNRVRSDPELQGLTPRTLRSGIIRKAQDSPQEIIQVRETRSEYRADRAYYYKIVMNFDGVPYPIFAELILSDDDPEYPAVTIVSAHRQRS